jgi:hypothetical protein
MIQDKYHQPIEQNLKYIESLIDDGAKVLEIGPGFKPFSKATHFVVGLRKNKEDLKIIK